MASKIWHPTTLYSSGVPALDKVLGGGYRSKNVVVIVGNEGVGKTALLTAFMKRNPTDKTFPYFRNYKNSGHDDVLVLGKIEKPPKLGWMLSRDIRCSTDEGFLSEINKHKVIKDMELTIFCRRINFSARSSGTSGIQNLAFADESSNNKWSAAADYIITLQAGTGNGGCIGLFVWKNEDGKQTKIGKLTVEFDYSSNLNVY